MILALTISAWVVAIILLGLLFCLGAAAVHAFVDVFFE